MRWFYSFLVAALVSSNLSAASRPNIVFILADDLGYGDLSCYGCPDIRTPNLDRLATQGVRLTDFYANGPVCTPTRCGLMTGRYQQRLGGMEWAIHPHSDWLGLPEGEKTIAQLMREAGYATAMSGKWHLGHVPASRPNRHGFERFFGLLGGNHNYFTHQNRFGENDLFLDGKPVERKGYSTDLITDHAVKFLSAFRQQRKPFFLYVAYNAPHWPFQGPGDEQIEIKPGSRDWFNGTRETYVSMVERMDAGIGRILKSLADNGLADDTLVVFTSDNGGDKNSRNVPLAKQKGTLWEGGIRVPCIVRWSGKLPVGRTSNQVGMTMDFSASFLKLVGADVPRDRPLDGIDLLPILAGDQPTRSRTLFWRRVDALGRKTHRAVRDGRWKYIDETDGKQYLYDLSADIGETRNLADGMVGRTAAMKKQVDNWEADVDPPLFPRKLNQVEK